MVPRMRLCPRFLVIWVQGHMRQGRVCNSFLAPAVWFASPTSHRHSREKLPMFSKSPHGSHSLRGKAGVSNQLSEETYGTVSEKVSDVSLLATSGNVPVSTPDVTICTDYHPQWCWREPWYLQLLLWLDRAISHMVDPSPRVIDTCNPKPWF